MIPILLHIPHSSTHIPNEYRSGILLSDVELQAELIRLTDLYTDELYALDNAARAVFPVSRFLVDPERFSNDAQEPMAARGMGVIYTTTTELKSLRLEPDASLRQELLSRYYEPHHAFLNEWADKALATHGRSLLIDCHSFPSRALPYEFASDQQIRPEICLGTDSFHTPSALADYAKKSFQNLGYQVELDQPFSGTLTPGNHYQKSKNLMSLMIEIRKDLYVNENTGERNARFATVQADITTILKGIETFMNESMSS